MFNLITLVYAMLIALAGYCVQNHKDDNKDTKFLLYVLALILVAVSYSGCVFLSNLPLPDPKVTPVATSSPTPTHTISVRTVTPTPSSTPSDNFYNRGSIKVAVTGVDIVESKFNWTDPNPNIRKDNFVLFVAAQEKDVSKPDPTVPILGVHLVREINGDIGFIIRWTNNKLYDHLATPGHEDVPESKLCGAGFNMHNHETALDGDWTVVWNETMVGVLSPAANPDWSKSDPSTWLSKLVWAGDKGRGPGTLVIRYNPLIKGKASFQVVHAGVPWVRARGRQSDRYLFHREWGAQQFSGFSAQQSSLTGMIGERLDCSFASSL